MRCSVHAQGAPYLAPSTLPTTTMMSSHTSSSHFDTQPHTQPHTRPVHRYRVGEARFMSDLISTLGILRDHLMTEATNAKHRVNVSCTPTSASLSHSMALVWPQV